MGNLPQKWIGWILVVVTIVAAIDYLHVGWVRVFYPYGLDFVEDAMLLQAWRVARGLPVFVPPNATFAPQVYMPLYTWLGGVLLRLTGLAFWPLRGLSYLATGGTAVLILLVGRREGAGWAWAASGAGLFLAGYRISGGWYDLARVDPLFVFLGVLGVAIAAYGLDRRSRLMAAGLVMGLAFLTKQNGLLLAFVLGLFLSLKVGWRSGWYGVTFAMVTAVPILVLEHISKGWFSYYVIDIAYASPIDISRLWPNLRREYLLTMVGLMLMLALLVLLLWRRDSWRFVRINPWLVMMGTAVIISSAGRASVGGNLNNQIIGYSFLCLLPGLLAAEMLKASRIDKGTSRLSTQGQYEAGMGRATRYLQWIEVLSMLLILLQFGLAWRPPIPYTAQQYLPTAEMRQAGAHFVTTVAQIEGEVLVMLHPVYALFAGKSEHVHIQTLWHARLQGQQPLPSDLIQQIENQTYAAIISDESPYFETEPVLVDLIEQYYEVGAIIPIVASPATLSGIVVRPQVVYRPRVASGKSP